jgi:hypothetical protein
MLWSQLGWDGAQYAAWLTNLPTDLQKELQDKLPAQSPTGGHVGVQSADASPNALPWDMSSGPVKELLSELGLLPLYGQTFAEYGLTKINQLTSSGPDGMHALLCELGAHRRHTWATQSINPVAKRRRVCTPRAAAFR